VKHGVQGHAKLTSNAGKQLASKLLDLTAREWYETIALEEIEHTLSQQVCNNANVVSEIETIPKVNTLVAVALIV
jgi:hypothetical protein